MDKDYYSWIIFGVLVNLVFGRITGWHLEGENRSPKCKYAKERWAKVHAWGALRKGNWARIVLVSLLFGIGHLVQYFRDFESSGPVLFSPTLLCLMHNCVEEKKSKFYITSCSFFFCNPACSLQSLDQVGHIVSGSGDLLY